MTFRKRNPGCYHCRWFDGSGSVDLGVCRHPKNIGPGMDWRGEDDTSYIENPWNKNHNRRCRDFEAKEGK